MSKAKANGIEIEYEIFGEEGGRPLLLIMGLGAQMILWDEELCAMLAERGHRVIRFDNRDVGLSTKLDDAGVPDVMGAMTSAMQGRRPEAPYTLSDMAADSAGLLDALGIEKAHVVGASMGGMIAQMVAVEHPSRVLSLTSIMSSTGNPELPQASPEVMSVLLTPPPADREGNIEHTVNLFRTIGSPGFPFDEKYIRARSARTYDRCFHPVGLMRQLVAIVASGNRAPGLKDVRVPTLVIHGKADPLVPVEAGIDTAKSIPGAELMLVEGMGHDLPRPKWPDFADAIARLTAGV